jgi:hypothetical protein
VGLAGSTVLARVEEGKQALLLAIRSGLPRLQTSERRLQVILFKNMCLLLIGLGGNNEVFSDDGELIEHQ